MRNLITHLLIPVLIFFALDSKQIKSNSVVDAIKSAEDIGKAKYHTFLKERLYNNTIDFNDTMSKTICLCYVLIHKRKLQSTLPISPIWMMTFHFSQECMYRVSLEEVTWILSLNMKIMLGHHPLALNGIKHQTKKSDLMECLESLAPQPDNIPDVMLVLS